MSTVPKGSNLQVQAGISRPAVRPPPAAPAITPAQMRTVYNKGYAPPVSASAVAAASAPSLTSGATQIQAPVTASITAQLPTLTAVTQQISQIQAPTNPKSTYGYSVTVNGQTYYGSQAQLQAFVTQVQAGQNPSYYTAAGKNYVSQTGAQYALEYSNLSSTPISGAGGYQLNVGGQAVYGTRSELSALIRSIVQGTAPSVYSLFGLSFASQTSAQNFTTAEQPVINLLNNAPSWVTQAIANSILQQAISSGLPVSQQAAAVSAVLSAGYGASSPNWPTIEQDVQQDAQTNGGSMPAASAGQSLANLQAGAPPGLTYSQQGSTIYWTQTTPAQTVASYVPNPNQPWAGLANSLFGVVKPAISAPPPPAPPYSSPAPLLNIATGVGTGIGLMTQADVQAFQTAVATGDASKIAAAVGLSGSQGLAVGNAILAGNFTATYAPPGSTTTSAYLASIANPNAPSVAAAAGAINVVSLTGQAGLALVGGVANAGGGGVGINTTPDKNGNYTVNVGDPSNGGQTYTFPTLAGANNFLAAMQGIYKTLPPLTSAYTIPGVVNGAGQPLPFANLDAVKSYYVAQLQPVNYPGNASNNYNSVSGYTVNIGGNNYFFLSIKAANNFLGDYVAGKSISGYQTNIGGQNLVVTTYDDAQYAVLSAGIQVNPTQIKTTFDANGNPTANASLSVGGNTYVGSPSALKQFAAAYTSGTASVYTVNGVNYVDQAQASAAMAVVAARSATATITPPPPKYFPNSIGTYSLTPTGPSGLSSVTLGGKTYYGTPSDLQAFINQYYGLGGGTQENYSVINGFNIVGASSIQAYSQQATKQNYQYLIDAQVNTPGGSPNGTITLTFDITNADGSSGTNKITFKDSAQAQLAVDAYASGQGFSTTIINGLAFVNNSDSSESLQAIVYAKSLQPPAPTPNYMVPGLASSAYRPGSNASPLVAAIAQTSPTAMPSLSANVRSYLSQTTPDQMSTGLTQQAVNIQAYQTMVMQEGAAVKQAIATSPTSENTLNLIAQYNVDTTKLNGMVADYNATVTNVQNYNNSLITGQPVKVSSIITGYKALGAGAPTALQGLSPSSMVIVGHTIDTTSPLAYLRNALTPINQLPIAFIPTGQSTGQPSAPAASGLPQAIYSLVDSTGKPILDSSGQPIMTYQNITMGQNKPTTLQQLGSFFTNPFSASTLATAGGLLGKTVLSPASTFLSDAGKLISGVTSKTSPYLKGISASMPPTPSYLQEFNSYVSSFTPVSRSQLGGVSSALTTDASAILSRANSLISSFAPTAPITAGIKSAPTVASQFLNGIASSFSSKANYLVRADQIGQSVSAPQNANDPILKGLYSVLGLPIYSAEQYLTHPSSATMSLYGGQKVGATRPTSLPTWNWAQEQQAGQYAFEVAGLSLITLAVGGSDLPVVGAAGLGVRGLLTGGGLWTGFNTGISAFSGQKITPQSLITSFAQGEAITGIFAGAEAVLGSVVGATYATRLGLPTLSRAVATETGAGGGFAAKVASEADAGTATRSIAAQGAAARASLFGGEAATASSFGSSLTNGIIRSVGRGVTQAGFMGGFGYVSSGGNVQAAEQNALLGFGLGVAPGAIGAGLKIGGRTLDLSAYIGKSLLYPTEGEGYAISIPNELRGATNSLSSFVSNWPLYNPQSSASISDMILNTRRPTNVESAEGFNTLINSIVNRSTYETAGSIEGGKLAQLAFTPDSVGYYLNVLNNPKSLVNIAAEGAIRRGGATPNPNIETSIEFGFPKNVLDLFLSPAQNEATTLPRTTPAKELIGIGTTPQPQSVLGYLGQLEMSGQESVNGILSNALRSIKNINILDLESRQPLNSLIQPEIASEYALKRGGVNYGSVFGTFMNNLDYTSTSNTQSIDNILRGFGVSGPQITSGAELNGVSGPLSTIQDMFNSLGGSISRKLASVEANPNPFAERISARTIGAGVIPEEDQPPAVRNAPVLSSKETLVNLAKTTGLFERTTNENALPYRGVLSSINRNLSNIEGEAVGSIQGSVRVPPSDALSSIGKNLSSYYKDITSGNVSQGLFDLENGFLKPIDARAFSGSQMPWTNIPEAGTFANKIALQGVGGGAHPMTAGQAIQDLLDSTQRTFDTIFNPSGALPSGKPLPTSAGMAKVKPASISDLLNLLDQKLANQAPSQIGTGRYGMLGPNLRPSAASLSIEDLLIKARDQELASQSAPLGTGRYGRLGPNPKQMPLVYGSGSSVEVSQSYLHGVGAFATANIPQGSTIDVALLNSGKVDTVPFRSFAGFNETGIKTEANIKTDPETGVVTTTKPIRTGQELLFYNEESPFTGLPANINSSEIFRPVTSSLNLRRIVPSPEEGGTTATGTGASSGGTTNVSREGTVTVQTAKSETAQTEQPTTKNATDLSDTSTTEVPQYGNAYGVASAEFFYQFFSRPPGATGPQMTFPSAPAMPAEARNAPSLLGMISPLATQNGARANGMLGYLNSLTLGIRTNIQPATSEIYGAIQTPSDSQATQQGTTPIQSGLFGLGFQNLFAQASQYQYVQAPRFQFDQFFGYQYAQAQASQFQYASAAVPALVPQYQFGQLFGQLFQYQWPNPEEGKYPSPTLPVPAPSPSRSGGPSTTVPAGAYGYGLLQHRLSYNILADLGGVVSNFINNSTPRAASQSQVQPASQRTSTRKQRTRATRTPAITVTAPTTTRAASQPTAAKPATRGQAFRTTQTRMMTKGGGGFKDPGTVLNQAVFRIGKAVNSGGGFRDPGMVAGSSSFGVTKSVKSGGGFADPGMVAGTSRFGTTGSVKMGSAFRDPGVVSGSSKFGTSGTKTMGSSFLDPGIVRGISRFGTSGTRMMNGAPSSTPMPSKGQLASSLKSANSQAAIPVPQAAQAQNAINYAVKGDKTMNLLFGVRRT